MGVKVKPYNNVPSRLAGVRPKKKPVPETPAQRKKRERLTRGLGDVELRADLESYMRENPLAKLGYDVVTTGVSGEEDRQGITAFIADKTRLNTMGQASYDHPWGGAKKYVKGLQEAPSVWYSTAYDRGVYQKKKGKKGLHKVRKTRGRTRGVDYSKHGEDLATLSHELGHIGEMYLRAMQDPIKLREKGADRYHGELLQRRIDALRRKYINSRISGVSRKLEYPAVGSSTHFDEATAKVMYPQGRIEPKQLFWGLELPGLVTMKPAAKELKRRRAAKRKRSNKNKSWNY